MPNISISTGAIGTYPINSIPIDGFIVYEIITNIFTIIGVNGSSLNSLENLVNYYYWDFGDINNLENNIEIVSPPNLQNTYYHEYTQSGTYTIRLVEVRTDGTIIENTQDIIINV